MLIVNCFALFSMKKLLLACAFIIAIIGGSYIVYSEGILPVNKSDTTPQAFVIHKGDTVNMIINNLALERLIRNRVVMYGIIRQLGIAHDIQAGSFRLSPSMDAYQIATALTKATDDVWVTVPEGLRKEEIAEIFSRDLTSFSASEFMSKAEEGRLFPDTYLVPRMADADFMIKLMTDTYQTKYSDELKAKARQLKLSEREVLILASMVERESIRPQDRTPIASIYLRRLLEPMRLQVDATVQYALGYQKDEKSWWKRPLYLGDLKVDSPYNTYERDGLPYGPICNPGLASIRAVVEADPKTPHIFYVNDADGRIHFSENYENHLKLVDKYVNVK